MAIRNDRPAMNLLRSAKIDRQANTESMPKRRESFLGTKPQNQYDLVKNNPHHEAGVDRHLFSFSARFRYQLRLDSP
jgi:hypothetical protein